MYLTAFFLIAPLVAIYFLVIKGADRYEPEPLWMLGLCFAWGAVVATAVSLIGNQIGGEAVSWVLGAGLEDSVVRASTASFVAPVVEEAAKGSALLVLWGVSALFLHELDGPLDGAIYGGVIGLGFTLTEDVMYVGGAAAEGIGAFTAVLFLRTVLGGLSHASFTAVTGLFVGMAAEARSSGVKLLAPVGGYTLAVMLHSLHNFLVTFSLAGGAGLVLKILVFWLFNLLFFALVVGLALRDRGIVQRGLAQEPGLLAHSELAQLSSGWMLLPFWNYLSLAQSPGGHAAARRKQLDLIELAFLKHRAQRGSSRALQEIEARLRRRIAEATQAGVRVGRPG